jgi:hypothetical protein
MVWEKKGKYQVNLVFTTEEINTLDYFLLNLKKTGVKVSRTSAIREIVDSFLLSEVVPVLKMDHTKEYHQRLCSWWEGYTWTDRLKKNEPIK